MSEQREPYVIRCLRNSAGLTSLYMRRAVLLADTLRQLGCEDEANRIMRLSADECSKEIHRRVWVE